MNDQGWKTNLKDRTIIKCEYTEYFVQSPHFRIIGGEIENINFFIRFGRTQTRRLTHFLFE